MKTPALAALSLLAACARGSDLVEVAPLTDRVVLLHFKDGYVMHHKRGQKRSDERVVAVPLETAKATSPGAYAFSSATDPAYKSAKPPVAVHRKSKGTDFAWFADRWVNDHAENDRPDHTEEHWLYLSLPKPLKRGAVYRLSTGGLATNGRTFMFRFDERKTRSEAVHTNLIGYAPAAPAKFGYVYAWTGDGGSLDLKPYGGKPFHLLDATTGKAVFTGKTSFRKAADTPETGQLTETPNGNFLDADVYECDFSRFATPGRYLLSIDGVGCSLPFRIDADIYRLPFRTVARGLYHNRSGIALTKPYTDFERPAPHNPNLTPGFKGKLRYSTLRYLDYGSESGTREAIEPTLKGPLDAWGWYQDAGDWDSYESHLRVAQELLLAYDLNPKAFRDGDLNIPESGNSVPDILDEAAWLPRFCHRLRKELLEKRYGTGGIGLRVSGDAFGSDAGPGDVGRGSWEDVDRIWVVSGEDPVSTFRYAGAAAGLARVLPKDPEGVDWAKEARESYDWAIRNTRENDPVRPNRLYAAAALFRLTGDRKYEEQVRADFDPNRELWFENLYGPAVYALAKDQDPGLLAEVREAIFRTADASHESAARRALRWGGNWNFPMLIGQQTTPWVMEIAVASRLTEDAGKKKAYLADLYTTCDYFLGTNALNQTWVTGLGPRHPVNVFHMDGWYNGKPTVHPGIIPYGPWRKDRDRGQGPWDKDWPNATVYPSIDRWPGNERYFDNRCSPMTGEFTIHQNTAPAAAIFGVLCAARP